MPLLPPDGLFPRSPDRTSQQRWVAVSGRGALMRKVLPCDARLPERWPLAVSDEECIWVKEIAFAFPGTYHRDRFGLCASRMMTERVDCSEVVPAWEEGVR